MEPWTSQSDEPLGLHLSIGLPPGSDWLVHHDLDNFLEPLAPHLGSHRILRASATKNVGGPSTMSIGRVEPADDPQGEWRTATIEAPGLSPSAQRTLGRQLAEQADPLPWTPVELEIALRMGLARKPVNAWKPLIDSLVAILGRAPGKTEFDIEDGRIVSLVIHQDFDPSLQHAVQARLWWRATEPAQSGGPPLSYRVGAPDIAVAQRRPRDA